MIIHIKSTSALWHFYCVYKMLRTGKQGSWSNGQMGQYYVSISIWLGHYSGQYLVNVVKMITDNQIKISKPRAEQIGLHGLEWSREIVTYWKITQRNTNHTASHKSISKIYILYEVIYSLFALSHLCFVCMPQMIISLCIK